MRYSFFLISCFIVSLSYSQVELRNVTKTLPISYYEIDTINSPLLNIIEKHLDSAKYYYYDIEPEEDVICLYICFYSIFDPIDSSYIKTDDTLSISTTIVKICNKEIYRLTNKVGGFEFYKYRYKDSVDVYILVTSDIPLNLDKSKLRQKEFIVSYRKFDYNPEGRLPFSFLGETVDWTWYYDTFIFTIMPLKDIL